MEDLNFNLSQEEFSKGRKILLWILATFFTGIGLWDLYLKIFKHDSYAKITLTVILLVLGAFVYFIAALATMKRKQHHFIVDNNHIDYRYGLLFTTHHNYKWDDIEIVYMPPHTKKTILELKNGHKTHINLTWIERNKSRIIRKHIYYSAKARGIKIIKK